ncbi:hypothetical protein [Variovorax sp. PBL-E5]|uniref:hypothetical protein n=1 Tax=Variovorax sp. PBL-E5 TaxID=434014 RepID=UPI0013163559|nr:hypothetical protein [Variovorax sp. PBL-E5]VTU46060.1 gentisate 1,2-dioxygenase [Variovorax sp. PBL-E5]
MSVATLNPAERDAIFHVPEGAFDRGLAEVPPCLFADEQRRALGRNAPTGLIAMDLSSMLGLGWPATTPAMLARYVVLRGGDSISHAFEATGEVFYVIRGEGATQAGEARIEWAAGDLFVLPGASATQHEARADSVLFCVTNEPEICYGGVRAPMAADNQVVAPALFRSAKIDESLGVVQARTGPQRTAGKSVIFATTPMARMKSILPTMTAAVNTLEPGGNQRPHLHNAAALTLAIESEGVYSMVAGERIDWIPFGLMVTPARAMHSHHNRGAGMMKSLVLQDGALYYQLRNPGFAWTA